MEKIVGPKTEARRQGYWSFGENGLAGKPVGPFSLFGVDISRALGICQQPSKVGDKLGGSSKTGLEPLELIVLQSQPRNISLSLAFFGITKRVEPKIEDKEVDLTIARALASKK